ncbi:hypothetical protein BJ165DRAFT_342012 [Panaeolus papilionaceus]|nr:hypothetical protein BJ165DRAFT_342012 [Panaeolus papilionaceus]
MLMISKFIDDDDKSSDFELNEAVVVRPAMTISKAEPPQPQPQPESAQPTEGLTTEHKQRDRLSDAARHAYTPSDGSIPPTRGFGEGDVAVGHGGVSFYRFGIEGSADGKGVLPGYPTPAGMSTLISDRMKADRARAREVGRGTLLSLWVFVCVF